MHLQLQLNYLTQIKFVIYCKSSKNTLLLEQRQVSYYTNSLIFLFFSLFALSFSFTLSLFTVPYHSLSICFLTYSVTVCIDCTLSLSLLLLNIFSSHYFHSFQKRTCLELPEMWRSFVVSWVKTDFF